MASTYLSKTFSAGNQKTWTWSFWTKIPNYDASNNKAIFSGYNDANNVMKIQFTNTDQFQSYGLSGGTLVCRLVTNQLFRDYNGWFHIVYSLDTTQATSTDRQKLWVNGEEVTSFSTRTDPSPNADLQINNTIGHQIGAANNADHYSNCMAHCHFIDGIRYDASYFGQTDATSGIWTPKISPNVTYGTNGFFLKFANSASLGTDSSGNGNNFTVNGSGTQTLDTPSNVFATFNPLDKSGGTVTTFSNGNTTTMHNAGSNGAVTASRSTLGYSSGKWYWEAKCIAIGGDVRTGIISMSSTDYVTTANPYALNEAYNYKQTGEKGSSSANAPYGATYTAGDIIGIAHDADNGSLTFYKNGVSQGVAFSGLNTSLFWGAFSTEYNQGKYSYNFGNGYFGTTPITTPESDSAGIGKFEYSVPSGYYALCTKNIATYG